MEVVVGEREEVRGGLIMQFAESGQDRSGDFLEVFWKKSGDEFAASDRLPACVGSSASGRRMLSSAPPATHVAMYELQCGSGIIGTTSNARFRRQTRRADHDDSEHRKFFIAITATLVPTDWAGFDYRVCGDRSRKYSDEFAGRCRQRL